MQSYKAMHANLNMVELKRDKEHYKTEQKIYNVLQNRASKGTTLPQPHPHYSYCHFLWGERLSPFIRVCVLHDILWLPTSCQFAVVNIVWMLKYPLHHLSRQADPTLTYVNSIIFLHATYLFECDYETWGPEGVDARVEASEVGERWRCQYMGHVNVRVSITLVLQILILINQHLPWFSGFSVFDKK